MIGVIDQVHHSYPRLIHLPESDRLRIGRPAKTLAQAKFLLVDPIEGTVDDFVRSVACQRCYLEGVHVLYVQIVPHDVRHLVTAGREGGEHQARRLGVPPAQLSQVPGRYVQHPVIAAGLLTPHLARVCEDEKTTLVGGQGVVVHRQGCIVSGRYQQVRRHVGFCGIRRDVMPHQVARWRARRLLHFPTVRLRGGDAATVGGIGAGAVRGNAKPGTAPRAVAAPRIDQGRVARAAGPPTRLGE